MSAARKILLALVIVVILFLLLLIAGALTYKPTFEVKGIGIVDHDGYPCFKIPFKTSNYPVTFRLLTKEGELIDTYVADKPEEVVYLHLTPFKPFTNVIGPKSYVIKAFYGDKEVYSSSFDVKGAKADLKIKDVSFNTSILFTRSEKVKKVFFTFFIFFFALAVADANYYGIFYKNFEDKYEKVKDWNEPEYYYIVLMERKE